MPAQDSQIEGNEPWPFSLRAGGRPARRRRLAGLQQMVGQATVSWLHANVTAYAMNRGAINAVLKDGTLTFVPVDVEVNGGKLLLSPSIRLAAQPAEIDLPRGPMLDHLELKSTRRPRPCDSLRRSWRK